MASMLESDHNDIDEDQRHMHIASVLDGMDEEEAGDNNEDQGSQNSAVFQLKMLVWDSVAGGIIGKGGKNISDLQAQSNSHIKVSQANDFYPGTNDRAILLTGPVHSVIIVQELIWNIVAIFAKPRESRGGNFPPPLNQGSDVIVGKVLIPNEAAGVIIGRAGANIKTIQEESGARVQINPKEELETKISKERVLTISGTKEACVECTNLIIRRLQEDPVVHYQNTTVSYGHSSFGDIRSDGKALRRPQNAPPTARMVLPMGAETTSATSSITINVPDAIIGYVLGKRGSVIAEIQLLSGAKVVVSPRNPRETDGAAAPAADETAIRVVTITGTPNAAQMAQFLITQKLQLVVDGKASSPSGDRRRR